MIIEFSSKSVKYNNVDAVISLILRNKHSPKNLHIVMCHHHQRLEDIDNIIHSMPNGIKFNIVCDEIDNLMSKNFVEDKLRYWSRHKNIEHIILQTATPTEYMFKKLKRIGIHKLKPIEKLPFMKISNREEKNKRYCNSSSHTFIHKYGGNNSLVILERAVKNGDIDINKKGLALFVPGENKQNTHENIRDYGLRKGFDIMFINGEFKGFYFQPGKGRYRRENAINVINFNKFIKMAPVLSNISELSELRDIAREYREMFPNSNLIITGGYCVKRGITICTNGFNLTHVILSDYWLNQSENKDYCEHNQLFGRVTGNSKYIKPAVIFVSEFGRRVRKAYEINHIDVKKQNKEYITDRDYNFIKLLENKEEKVTDKDSSELKYNNKYLRIQFGTGSKQLAFSTKI